MSTLLIFDGQAEAALKFYTSLFADASNEFIHKYTAAGPAKKGL